MKINTPRPQTFDIFDLKLDEIPSLDDKLQECQFFLNLAASENDIEKFRWFTSAFLSASRSYIDVQVRLFYLTNNGEMESHQQSKDTFNEIKNFIDVKIDKNGWLHIKANHPVIDNLINTRNINTHRNSLLIRNVMNEGGSLQDPFIKDISTKTGALDFMRRVFKTLNDFHEIAN